MPRPARSRRICAEPQVKAFSPDSPVCREPILLTLDEYEVIRLVDLQQRTHEQCAAQMDIARPCRRSTRARGASSPPASSTGSLCASAAETAASAADRSGRAVSPLAADANTNIKEKLP